MSTYPSGFRARCELLSRNVGSEPPCSPIWITELELTDSVEVADQRHVLRLGRRCGQAREPESEARPTAGPAPARGALGVAGRRREGGSSEARQAPADGGGGSPGRRDGRFRRRATARRRFGSRFSTLLLMLPNTVDRIANPPSKLSGQPKRPLTHRFAIRKADVPGLPPLNGIENKTVCRCATICKSLLGGFIPQIEKAQCHPNGGQRGVVGRCNKTKTFEGSEDGAGPIRQHLRSNGEDF